MRADPLRERSWELLALAHYRAGRQGEALDALRRARAAIAEELGTDPSPALADMQTAILHHDPALRPRRSPRRRVTASVPHPLTSFVGRGTQLDAVSGALESHRLVTITGPGGMGK